MNGFNWQGVTEIWVACGTKYGKTLSASAALVTAAPRKPQSLWRWVAPIYTQSQIGFNYCRRMLPGEPYVKARENSLILQFPSIDTRIQYFHGQHPESLEGEATAGNILDEAAKMKETVYAAVKTTTTVTRGIIIPISTPFGKNWFYKGCMAAKEEMARAKFEGRDPTKIFITARTIDNPKVSQAAIEEARRSLPDRLFRQYYLAEFVDDGNVFSGFRKCLFGDALNLYGDNQSWFMPDCDEMTVVIGADWAKTVDWTVFFAIELKTRRVVGYYRFHKKTYTEAIRQLMLFSRKFKEVEIVYHDKTGVGVAIDDQMAYTGLNYRGITFTQQSKSEMVNRLITAFEQTAIWIPRLPVLEAELDSFEVSTNALGNMSYSAPTGEHDDSVCSLMLAHAALLQYGERDMTIRYLEDLPKDKKLDDPSTIEEYYQRLSLEEDDF